MTDTGSAARSMTATDEVLAALAAFDRTFAAGDAAALTERFTEEGQMLLLYRDPLEGRAALLEHWSRFFGEWDPAAWQTEHRSVEVHGDRAFALSTYTETLVHRGGEPSRLVNGRLVRFLRRDADGQWRVTMAMNSHSRPVEQVT